MRNDIAAIVRRHLDWLLLAVPLVVLLLPLASGHSFWLRDILRYAYPQKFYLRERLLAGELPLWNPFMGLGRPFLGEVHPGVFDPLGALLLLPVPLGADLYMAVHLFIAATGMRVWLRALGHDPRSASLGGALFALSGYFVSVLAGNGAYAFGVAFVPWVLSQVVRAPTDISWRMRARRAGVIALLFAWAFASGDPMAVYFGGACGIAQAVGLESRAARLRALGALAMSAVPFVPMTAAQWLPALDVVRVARPGGVPFDDASHFAFHPARLLEFVWPGSFGTPHTPQWFVHPLYAEGTGHRREPWAAGVYVGLATWPLAVYAIASRKRRAVDLAFGTLAMIALVTAMGRNTPLWWLVFHVVPGARLFRYPEMYLFVATIMLVVLAIRGLDLAFEHPARALRGAIVWWAVLVFALVAAPMFARVLSAVVGGVPIDTVRSVLSVRAWSAVAIATIVLLPVVAAARGRITADTARLLVAIVLVVDVLLPARGLANYAPSSVYARSPFARALLAAVPASERDTVRLYRPSTVDLSTDEDRAVLEARSLQPNSGTNDGIDQLDVYDLFHSPREVLLWSSFESAPLRMLQLTGTRYALLDDAQLGPHGGGLRVIVHDRRTHATLVEVPDAAPRVFFASAVIGAPDERFAARAMHAPDFAPGRSAAIEGAIDAVAAGACRAERYRPERIEIACESERASYVVVNDLRFDGWTALVNGAPADILAANVTMRAVRIPAGSSHVSMRYLPLGWPWAPWLSLMSTAACIALVVALRRRTTRLATATLLAAGARASP